MWPRVWGHRHGGGLITTYGHNNRNLVTVGQLVHAGQPIAEVGDRGNATGPHLHFAIQLNSHYVDPLGFYASKGTRVIN